MHQLFKRTAAALSCAVTMTAALPFVPASAGTYETSALYETTVSYDDTEQLQTAFQSMLDGNISIYMDEDKTPVPGGVTVDSRLDNSQRYYVFNSKDEYIYGKQCYIVAQAIYTTLFDDFALHADETEKYDHSEVAIGLCTGISYDLFFEKKIKPGAYLRTTGEKDGTFSSKNGHSMIILGYDYNNVTILEGNGDANGQIHLWTITYEKFNAYYLARKDRVIGHIVQPTASYYKKKFGYVSPTEKEEPPIEPEYEYKYLTLRRLNHQIQLDKPEDGMTWESTDPEVISVDENGLATVHQDGYATVTGMSERYQYTFSVEVDAIPWESVGDADGNGVTDMSDAKTILTYCVTQLADNYSYIDYAAKLRYDANNDGTVDLTDAQLVLSYHVMNQLSPGQKPEALWQQVLTRE